MVKAHLNKCINFLGRPGQRKVFCENDSSTADGKRETGRGSRQRADTPRERSHMCADVGLPEEFVATVSHLSRLNAEGGEASP